MQNLRSSTIAPPANRLRWQCRRGMLELDLLLDRFLNQGYDLLSDQQKVLFVRMLDTEDQLLLDWLMGYVVPSDGQVREIVDRVRATPAD